MAKKNAADWADEQTTGGKGTALDLPEGTERYKWVKGLCDLDVLPYLAGEGNPSADPGETWWCFKYFIHWFTGQGGKKTPYCCLHLNWGEYCPFCHFKGSEQAVKDMMPKARLLINVSDPKEPTLKVKLLETSCSEYAKSGFYKLLVYSIGMDKEEYGNFFELKGGYTLRMNVAEESFSGRTFLEPKNLIFKKREDLPSSILKKTLCLEKLLIKTPAEKLEKLLYQGVDPDENDAESTSPPLSKHDREEEPKERPARREEKVEVKYIDRAPKTTPHSKPAPKEEDNEDPTAEEVGIKLDSVVRHRGEMYVVTKVSKDGTSVTLRSQDPSEEPLVGVEPKDCKVLKDKTVNAKGKIVNIEPDDEEEKPTPKKVAAKKSSEDDDEDDGPPPSRSKAKAEPVAAGRRGSYDDDDSDNNDDDEE